MKQPQNVFNVGISDETVRIFERQYAVQGMAYNSYYIKDDHTAVLDTVDERYGDKWIENIRKIGDPEFLFITHVEPDHSSNVARFMREFPQAKIVANAKALGMIKNYFGTDFADRKMEVKDGDVFDLGSRELVFVSAPMVHWPEVQMIYDKTNGILFSADAFGRFGTREDTENWAENARKYYIGIVGKYGMQVQNVLKKAAALEIKAICPLHGNVITEDFGYYIGLYDVWSSYKPEKAGTGIFYTSVYGHTEKAVLKLAEELNAKGVYTEVFNLAECDINQAVSSAFKLSSAVFATTTYNMDVFPFMRDFLSRIAERNYRNRKVAFIENGSWAPNATKVMTGLLEKCADLTFCENTVKILSAPTAENYSAISALAEELARN